MQLVYLVKTVWGQIFIIKKKIQQKCLFPIFNQQSVWGIDVIINLNFPICLLRGLNKIAL